jgi:hypothetical protein
MQWSRNGDAVVFHRRHELLAGLLGSTLRVPLPRSYAIPTSGGPARKHRHGALFSDGRGLSIYDSRPLFFPRFVNIRLPTPFFSDPFF